MAVVDSKEVESFLYREASLLDNPDLDTWMLLYTEDGTYWMPAAVDQEDPLNHISHFYDDRVMMEIRRRNFVHPRAASKDSEVRSSHIISNIQLVGTTENDDLIVTSNFQVVMYYRNEQRVFAGTYEHHLRPAADSFLIYHKRVNLLNCDAPLKSIIIYL
jgi:benzoate/toluate 1,2-dioxygenase beta subunit